MEVGTYGDALQVVVLAGEDVVGRDALDGSLVLTRLGNAVVDVFVGKVTVGVEDVAGSQGGTRHLIDPVATIGIAAITLVACMLRVGQRVAPRQVRTRQDDLAHHVRIVGQLEVGMNLTALDVALTCPHDEMAVGRHHGDEPFQVARYLELRRLLRVVTQVHASQVDILVRAVVDLYPVILLVVVVDIHAVACAHLVDVERYHLLLRQFIGRERFEAGHEVHAARGRQFVGCLLGETLTLLAGGRRAVHARLPPEVAGSRIAVVHLHGHHVTALAQQAGRHLDGMRVGIVPLVPVVVATALARLVVRSSRPQVVDVHLLPVDIEDVRVIHLVGDAEDIPVLWDFFQQELPAQVARRDAVAAAIAAVELCRGIGHGLAGIAVAEGSRAPVPTLRIVVGRSPVLAVQRTVVVVVPLARRAEHRRGDAVAPAPPAREAVARRSLGLERDGGEEIAVEPVAGNGDAIEREACRGHVALHRHLLGLRAREPEGGVGLYDLRHTLAVVARHRIDDALGKAAPRAVGCVSLPAEGRCDAFCHPVHDACQFLLVAEHRTAHQAVLVDEETAELLVLQHVEEDGDEFHLSRDARPSVFGTRVEGIDLLAREVLEDVVSRAIHAVVEVKDHEMELAVQTRAEALGVVVWPVPVVEVELERHVVGIVIDIHQVADLLVGQFVGSLLAERLPREERLLGARLLHIARIHAHLEGIHLIVIHAVV